LSFTLNERIIYPCFEELKTPVRSGYSGHFGDLPMNMTIVSEENRSQFLYKHFKDPIFDLSVFITAAHLIDDYTGGYWDFVETETAPFLKLPTEETLKVSNAFTGEEVEVDATLAGMIVTFFALQPDVDNGKKEIKLSNNLKDAILTYCSEHKRMDVWMKIMD
jgi:hypothetical protein